MESERSGGTNVVYELLHETADERLVETEECISKPDCPCSSMRLMKRGKNVEKSTHEKQFGTRSE